MTLIPQEKSRCHFASVATSEITRLSCSDHKANFKNAMSANRMNKYKMLHWYLLFLKVHSPVQKSIKQKIDEKVDHQSIHVYQIQFLSGGMR